MAHGNNRINVCHNCKQVTLIPRFSKIAVCPDCGNDCEDISWIDLTDKYRLNSLYQVKPDFRRWDKIPENSIYNYIV